MKEFKVKPNLAVGIWLVALTLVWIYDIVMFALNILVANVINAYNNISLISLT